MLSADLDKIIREPAQRQDRAWFVGFARQRTPERKPVQIENVLQGALETLGYELRAHNIQVDVHATPDLPLTEADPYQLQQVFINVIANAWQAMDKAYQGGQLTIKVESGSSLSVVGPKCQVIRVVIQDTGPGIPAEVLPHIFDPFFTTKNPGEGTGLGLSTAYGIIGEHGGQIWAESQAGKGATFFIELPVVAPEFPGEHSAVEAAQPVEPVTAHILLVDDEASILDVVGRVLRRSGYQVDTAGNGLEGLSRLDKNSYDLILCDVHMPELSGQDFYQQVCNRDPQQGRRIIFTTGDTVSTTTRRFLRDSGVQYIGKPFDMPDLLEVVRKALGGKR
jgi:two-component system NtrC family sensor kinase